ncbi:MAG: hypothetical protein WCB36_04915 [Burkholderiales bacterium]
MYTQKIPARSIGLQRQRGIALLILLLILASGGIYALLRTLNQNSLQTERDRITSDSLAAAKQALIGYAVGMNLQPNTALRPGDLPCPDGNNDGSAESSCGNASGSNQTTRLGRLPWKTLSLSLPDLRDGYGERLWYAVSNNFKLSSRHNPLNTATNGTITVRDAYGNILHNASGTNTTGAIAVVIAPGPAIPRNGVMQVRSGAGVNSAANYLDFTPTEDNADFVDAGLNGFIQGNATNINSQINNDQMIVISKEDLMPLIIKRVEGERDNCTVPSQCRISKTDAGGWWVINGWQALYPVP